MACNISRQGQSVHYGTIYHFHCGHVAQKYLLPALQPPTETQLQQTQDALTAKYDEAAAVLAQLQADSQELKASMTQQQEKVDQGLGAVKEAVSEMRLADQERTETIKTCKEEIDAIKDMLPKVSLFIVSKSVAQLAG